MSLVRFLVVPQSEKPSLICVKRVFYFIFTNYKIHGVFRKALRVGLIKLENMEQHNPNHNKMERNFPFVNINFFDKMYDKLVLSATRKLDSGNTFKFIMVLTIHILSFAILLGVPAAFLYLAFGIDGGFISTGFKGVMAFIIGLPITLFTAWYGYSVARKRATQLNKEEYTSIIAFYFKKYTPLTITLTGELVAVFCFACVIPMILIGGEVSEMGGGIMAAFSCIAIGLGALIYAYAGRQIYFFILKIVISILNPLAMLVVAGSATYIIAGSVMWDGSWASTALVTIVCLYIFFMLLKKNIFTQWHDK